MSTEFNESSIPSGYKIRYSHFKRGSLKGDLVNHPGYLFKADQVACINDGTTYNVRDVTDPTTFGIGEFEDDGHVGQDFECGAVCRITDEGGSVTRGYVVEIKFQSADFQGWNGGIYWNGSEFKAFIYRGIYTSFNFTYYDLPPGWNKDRFKIELKYLSGDISFYVNETLIDSGTSSVSTRVSSLNLNNSFPRFVGSIDEGWLASPAIDGADTIIKEVIGAAQDRSVPNPFQILQPSQSARPQPRYIGYNHGALYLYPENSFKGSLGTGYRYEAWNVKASPRASVKELNHVGARSGQTSHKIEGDYNLEYRFIPRSNKLLMPLMSLFQNWSGTEISGTSIYNFYPQRGDLGISGTTSPGDYGSMGTGFFTLRISRQNEMEAGGVDDIEEFKGAVASELQFSIQANDVVECGVKSICGTVETGTSSDLYELGTLNKEPWSAHQVSVSTDLPVDKFIGVNISLKNNIESKTNVSNTGRLPVLGVFEVTGDIAFDSDNLDLQIQDQYISQGTFSLEVNMGSGTNFSQLSLYNCRITGYEPGDDISSLKFSAYESADGSTPAAIASVITTGFNGSTFEPRS